MFVTLAHRQTFHEYLCVCSPIYHYCLKYMHGAELLLWAGSAQSVSDLLRAGRSGDRIPVGARFSEPVQTNLGASTQPPIQWIPGHSRRCSRGGLVLTTRRHLVLRLMKE